MKTFLLGVFVAPLWLAGLVVLSVFAGFQSLGECFVNWWENRPSVRWRKVCKPCHDLAVAQGAHWVPDHSPEECSRAMDGDQSSCINQRAKAEFAKGGVSE